MPRKSVQHVKRKFRLSGKDLTILVKKQFPDAEVKYNFGDKQRTIGWYVHFTPELRNFIGPNWIAARDNINQLELPLVKNPLAFFGGIFS